MIVKISLSILWFTQNHLQFEQYGKEHNNVEPCYSSSFELRRVVNDISVKTAVHVLPGNCHHRLWRNWKERKYIKTFQKQYSSSLSSFWKKVSVNLQVGTTGSDLFLDLGGSGGLLGGKGSDVCLIIAFLLPAVPVLDDLHTGDFSIHSLWQQWLHATQKNTLKIIKHFAARYYQKETQEPPNNKR